MSHVVRPASALDAPACAAIVNGWIDATPWMPRTATADAIEAALRDGLPKREAWVIGDPVAGYLSMDPDEGHIWGFYVATPGQGLGAILMARARAGRSRLQLNTHAANTRAHGFYRREGFAQVGEAWVGSDGIPEIRMEWGA